MRSSLERLDYFIKCLKDKGIYISVDMTTYRRFKPGDGVTDAHLLHEGSRLYALYDPTMIELQKEFCQKFWNHYNPYTGLKHKDDPVFCMCVICNENDTMINHNARRWYNLIPHYDNMLRDMFNDWLKEKGIEYDAYGCELFTTDAPMIQFRVELMAKYCRTMYDYLRSLGVKIPAPMPPLPVRPKAPWQAPAPTASTASPSLSPNGKCPSPTATGLKPLFGSLLLPVCKTGPV